MNVLHVISSVNPETGGPIEVINSSASILAEHGCHQEILSLDSPHDAWTKTAALPLHAMGIRNPRYLGLRTKIPWLRYGYTPHFVPWLKKNAARYDAIIVHGLWNYVALGSWRALGNGKTPYFVYAHGMLDPYFNKIQPLKAAAKQILWWFSEGRLIAHARNVFFATEEERRLARRSFWPFRCRDRVVAFGTKDVARQRRRANRGVPRRGSAGRRPAVPPVPWPHSSQERLRSADPSLRAGGKRSPS